MPDGALGSEEDSLAAERSGLGERNLIVNFYGFCRHQKTINTTGNRVTHFVIRRWQHLSAQGDSTGRRAAGVSMPFFERYLSVWVVLCIGVGVFLGRVIPGFFETLGSLEVANVNLPVAVLIWLMILPMLLKIDFHSLVEVKQHWKGVGVTLFINWAVKPFSMALLAWIFIRNLFADWLPAEQLDSYIAGLIILAAAPCTAMVFVWSNLSDGHPGFTLSQVALNDLIMVFAFAPIVALLLGISSIHVPWDTLFLSVILYIVLPVIIAGIWRRYLMRGKNGEARLKRLLDRLHPVSLSALLLTLVLLFGFQGNQILDNPIIILLLAIPILIQVYFNSGLAYLLNKKLGVAHCIAAPSALIGASNFFELAVAAAISLFGLHSGAALATVVGVLVEVPVMLSVVWIVNRSRNWYET
jgi:ACR3 family arsenite transporter